MSSPNSYLRSNSQQIVTERNSAAVQQQTSLPNDEVDSSPRRLRKLSRLSLIIENGLNNSLSNSPRSPLETGLFLDKLLYSGRLYMYKHKRHGMPRWTETWVALYRDSMMVWYNDVHCTHKKGQIKLLDVLDDVEVAESAITRFAGHTPVPPFEGYNFFIVIPTGKKRKRNQQGEAVLDMRLESKQLLWFCAKRGTELGKWLAVFARLLNLDYKFMQLQSQLVATKTERTSTEDARINRKIQRRGSVKLGWGWVWTELKCSADGTQPDSPSYDELSKSFDWSRSVPKTDAELVQQVKNELKIISVEKNEQSSFSGSSVNSSTTPEVVPPTVQIVKAAPTPTSPTSSQSSHFW